ncbi:MAG: Gfo/Idh/MocA family oxidoreductase [Candidatus Dormibacteraeota bacterium]|nr:Gfo/Idh/MocA family oxidoreductase [Candidatus Dormibacteraeota bacterium]MBO0743926.1 Gfo/Idh/MocA family oxidoreductase [Candidatus Dormibacteraeota bacterium]
MTGRPALRVGVLGAGAMGGDHLSRLARRTHGAEVVAVVEPDADRRQAALAMAPGAGAFACLEDAIEGGGLDAVLIATPSAGHPEAVTAALDARLWVLCEKPLARDAGAARRIVDAEQRLDRPRVQVGFMRRFDVDYCRLRELIASGSAGHLLMLHCVHRNPGVTALATEEGMITDSAVHELDVVPWLAGSPVRAVEVRRGRSNSNSPAHLAEPLLVLVELESGVLADVEINMGAQFGYQVTTEAVLERGVARIGHTAGLQLWQEGHIAVAEHRGFLTRFRDAYDREVQAWVDAARRGTIGGPGAWDGYLAALACEAGVHALHTRGTVPVQIPPRPRFYG